MRRHQAFKFELLARGRQQRDMRRFAGACRYVFNQALALQKANYEGGGKFIGYVAMAKRLTEWRNGSETPWLKEAPVHPLQHALKDSERAYQNFFAKRAAFPRFKRKGQRASFRYPDEATEASSSTWPVRHASSSLKNDRHGSAGSAVALSGVMG
jgi:putative transposase